MIYLWPRTLLQQPATAPQMHFEWQLNGRCRRQPAIAIAELAREMRVQARRTLSADSGARRRSGRWLPRSAIATLECRQALNAVKALEDDVLTGAAASPVTQRDRQSSSAIIVSAALIGRGEIRIIVMMIGPCRRGLDERTRYDIT